MSAVESSVTREQMPNVPGQVNFSHWQRILLKARGFNTDQIASAVGVKGHIIRNYFSAEFSQYFEGRSYLKVAVDLLDKGAILPSHLVDRDYDWQYRINSLA